MSASGFLGIGRTCLIFTISKKSSASFLRFTGPPRVSAHRVSSLASKTLESEEEEEEERPFAVVSYLKDSCGFSLEAAKYVASQVDFDSPEKPDSVINLFKEQGFTDVQISKVIKVRPFLLAGNPKISILPKLEFFRSLGCSNTDIAAIFSRNPFFLMRSLDKLIVPCYDIIKSVVQVDAKAIRTFKSNLSHSHVDPALLASNIELLRKAGVHQSSLSLLLAHFPSVVFQKSSKFLEVLAEVKQMGFDPSKSYFVLAMWVLSSRNRSTLESKLDMFVRLGLSREDAWTVFKKQPLCMLFSEKKIEKVMDFFLTKTTWQSREIASCPQVFVYSLEKRTIPRCSVAHVLLSKRLVKSIRLSSLMSGSEEKFVKKYVIRFHANVPQLLDVYEGKEPCFEEIFSDSTVQLSPDYSSKAEDLHRSSGKH